MASRWTPSTSTWGQQAYDEVMARYPEIKSDTVALCTWAYAHNPEANIEELREIAATDKDLGDIRGRAQASARDILGLTRKKHSKGRKARAKRKAKRNSQQVTAPAGLEGFVQSVRALEKERDELRTTLEKIRDAVESVS